MSSIPIDAFLKKIFARIARTSVLRRAEGLIAEIPRSQVRLKTKRFSQCLLGQPNCDANDEAANLAVGPGRQLINWKDGLLDRLDNNWTRRIGNGYQTLDSQYAVAVPGKGGSKRKFKLFPLPWPVEMQRHRLNAVMVQAAGLSSTEKQGGRDALVDPRNQLHAAAYRCVNTFC